MNARSVRLVAGREITEQIRGRAFWISTAITVVAIALIVVLPTELRSGRPTYRVAVTAEAPPGATDVIAHAGTATGASVVVLTVPDDAAARAALRGGGPTHATVALVGGATPTVVVDRAFSATSTSAAARLAGAIAQQVSVVVAADRSGLSKSQAVALANPQALPVAHLRPAAVSNTKRVPALASAILLFIIVIRYGSERQHRSARGARATRGGLRVPGRSCSLGPRPRAVLRRRRRPVDRRTGYQSTGSPILGLSRPSNQPNRVAHDVLHLRRGTHRCPGTSSERVAVSHLGESG